MTMAFGFHDLPFDLCREILWVWVVGEVCTNMKVIHSMDVAYCNREQRKLFYNWVQHMPIQISTSRGKNTSLFLIWLTARHLRIKELIVCADTMTGLEYMTQTRRAAGTFADLFIHLQTITLKVKRKEFSESDILLVGHLLALAPSLQQVQLDVSFPSKDLKYFIKQIPNPYLVRSFKTQWQDSPIATEREEPWWTLTPHLRTLKLHLNINAIPPRNLFHQLSSSLLYLKELEIGQGVYEVTGACSSLFFPHLKVFRAFLIRCSSQLLIELLSGCPELVSLTIRCVTLLTTTTQEKAMAVLLAKIPQLQHFYWDYQHDNSFFTISLRVLVESETLSTYLSDTLDPDYLISAYPWQTVPFRLLQYLPLSPSPGIKVDVDVQLEETEDSPFWTIYARELPFITEIRMPEDVHYSWQRWETILSLPRLQSLHLDGESLDLDEVFKQCAACAIQSTAVTTLTFYWGLDSHSGLAGLLPSVFPNLTHLNFKKDNLTAGDLLQLLRLPKLKSLDVSRSFCNYDPLTILDEIGLDMWDRVAAITTCTTLDLLFVSIQSWSAVQRMVDSAMGRRLRTVMIVAIPGEQAAWTELIRNESLYLLSCPGRCRVDLDLHHWSAGGLVPI